MKMNKECDHKYFNEEGECLKCEFKREKHIDPEYPRLEPHFIKESSPLLPVCFLLLCYAVLALGSLILHCVRTFNSG